MRSTYVSWWNLPISSGSRDSIERWLNERGIRAKEEQTREQYFRPLQR